MAEGFAGLPSPPYYAVIFSSRRRALPGDGYADAAAQMLAQVQDTPGYLGSESARGADGFGITVSYFDSEAAIAQWRDEPAHAAVRRRGRAEWYEHFEVRVAKVERAYGQKEAPVR